MDEMRKNEIIKQMQIVERLAIRIYNGLMLDTISDEQTQKDLEHIIDIVNPLAGN